MHSYLQGSLIALVNHGPLLLRPPQHFSGLADEKCDSEVFMEDDSSHENEEGAAELYNRHRQQLKTLISPAVPSARLLSCHHAVPWGTCSFYEPLGLQLWSLCLKCCSVKSELRDRMSHTLDLLRLHSLPVPSTECLSFSPRSACRPTFEKNLQVLQGLQTSKQNCISSMWNINSVIHTSIIVDITTLKHQYCFSTCAQMLITPNLKIINLTLDHFMPAATKWTLEQSYRNIFVWNGGKTACKMNMNVNNAELK